MGIFTGRIITAVEIGKKEIKLLQAAIKGTGVEVVCCAYKEFEALSPASGAVALEEIFKENKIRPKDMILVIPRQCVTVKNLRLPTQNAKEIEDMAGFQAVKQIPYPKEEIVYGSYLTGMDIEGFSRILLTISHREAIEMPISVLRSCGLAPQTAVLSSFGILNWFNLNSELKKRSEASPIVLIDCDSDSADIAIISGGKLIYTRGLTFGSLDPQEYSVKLIEEMDRTLATYEKESGGQKPFEAVLTGNVNQPEDLIERLEERLNIKAEYIPSFAFVPLNITATGLSFVGRVSYSALLGAALSDEGIDLLPRELKAARDVRMRKKDIAFSSVLAFITAILLLFLLWNKFYQREIRLKALESELRAIGPDAREIEKIRSASEVVRSRGQRRNEALDILNELHKIVPSQIYLVLYTYDEEKVELKGTASVLSEVFKLVTILEQSSYFQNVQVRYATKRRIGTQEFVDFEIAGVLAANTGRGK